MTGHAALMKSGWLWRQSSVLKRWKLNWCDLWADGSLVFYKTDTRRDFESRAMLKSRCVTVKSGLECVGVVPPEGHTRESLVVVVMKNGSTQSLCANSEDEALAWKLTMMEARRNSVYMYNPYDDGYHCIPLDSHHAVYITPSCAHEAGAHHILIQQNRSDELLESVALGLLAGMATGAVMRSFMWMPFWFC